MTTATLPSGTGIVSTYAYDNADRLTSIAHVKAGPTTVASVAYTLQTAMPASSSVARTRAIVRIALMKWTLFHGPRLPPLDL
jgi:YD repeat-containing protein